MPLFIRFMFIFLVLSTTALLASNQVNHEKEHFKSTNNIEPVERTFELLPSPEGLIGNGNLFGQYVDLDNNRAIISAVQAKNQGVASIYEYINQKWQVTDYLEPPPEADYADNFGLSVAIWNNWAAVSMTGSVAVYYFDGSNWLFKQLLKSTDFETGIGYGNPCTECVVTMANNHLVIGDKGYYNTTPNRGAIFTYQLVNNSWMPVKKLYNTHQATTHYFGNAISLDGNRLAVGASIKEQGAQNPRPYIYIYEFNGVNWIETDYFTVGSEPDYPYPVSSISVSGDFIFLGNKFHSETPPFQSGAVHIFQYDNQNWTEVQKLIPSTLLEDERFGAEVNAFDNQLIVAVNIDNFPPSSSGAIYQYELSNGQWTERQRIEAISEISTNIDTFAYSLAQNNHHLLVGNKGINLYQDYTYHQIGGVFAFKSENSDWVYDSAIRPDSSSAFAGFGSTIDLDAEEAIVGAIYDITKGYEMGSATVFEFDGNEWHLLQKLLPSDHYKYGQFGASVKKHKDWLFVGAPRREPYGAVYAFKKIKSGWLPTQIIVPTRTSNRSGESFGTAIDISDKSLLIGAHLDNDTGGSNENYGAAFVFELNNGVWTEKQKLLYSDQVNWNYAGFGYDVSISNNTAVIGQPFHDYYTGSAVIFNYDGTQWIEQALIIPDDGENYDYFGRNVAIYGNSVVITNERTNQDYGYTYIYQNDGTDWNKTAQIMPSDSNQYGANCGSAISIWENQMLIGCPYGEASGTSSGAVYKYEFMNESWQLVERITQDNPSYYSDQFGQSVLNNEKHIMIGAPNSDTFGTNSGSVYIRSKLSDLIFKNSF